MPGPVHQVQESKEFNSVSNRLGPTLDRIRIYRDSGVEWLGKVPAHWEVRRIKTVFREKDDRSDEKDGELLSMTRSQGLIPQANASNRIASVVDLSNYKLLSSW